MGKKKIIAFLVLWITCGCNFLVKTSTSSPLPSQSPSPVSTATQPSATPTFLPTRIPIYYLPGDVIRDLRTLTVNLQVPEYFQVVNPEKRGGEFDPNSYFGALKNLSMEPGYILDYVYSFDGMGGEPFIYTRPIHQAPYRNIQEYTTATGVNIYDGTKLAEVHRGYLDHVKVNEVNEESFFQFIVLYIMGDQFYLYWNSNYNDTRLVVDTNSLTSVFNTLYNIGKVVPDDIQNQAFASDLRPVFKIKADTITFRMVTFTKWGGFFEDIYTIRKEFPHKISIESKNLVPYNCGIQF